MSDNERLAAYLFSIVQSAENSEDGAAATPLEKAYDQGILYAAKMLLDGADGGDYWPEHCGPTWADELRELMAPGVPAFDNDKPLVEDVDVLVVEGSVRLLGDGDGLLWQTDAAGARALAELLNDYADEASEEGQP